MLSDGLKAFKSFKNN